MKACNKIICTLLVITSLFSNNVNCYAINEEISSELNIETKYIDNIQQLFNIDNKAELYNMSYDILALMSQRYNYNRGQYKIYFDNLDESVKLDIIFYEALLIRIGRSEEYVNNFIIDYINFINRNGNGSIDLLNIINNVDTCIQNEYNIDNVSKELLIPYEPNVTSRLNMMLAATSLVGKVRYVWGGGHGLVGHLDTINPYWIQWNNLYNNSESLDRCIKPSGSWCPIHGDSNGICNNSELLTNMEEYKELRSDLYTFDNKYDTIFKDVDLSNSIPEHGLDGLDCSGYVSWVYNQITDRFYIDSTAINFVNVDCLEEIPFGDTLICGDIFAWAKHIVIIVGKVDKNAKVYVTLEQTPNTVKFGVIYYDDARYKDIEYAKQIATEANQLFGNLYSEEAIPNTYNMSSILTYIDDETQEEKQYCFIGRYKYKFEDENTKINNSKLKFKDMYAIDIIQYTLDKTLPTYISGSELYGGDLFNLFKDNVDGISSIN